MNSQSNYGSIHEQKLKQSFINQVLSNGYPSITVKSLTDEAGIGRTLFYNYYSSKADLAEDICYTFLDIHNEILAKSLLNISEQKTDALLDLAFDTIRDNANVIRALWYINESSFSPYLIMQQSMNDTILKTLSHNYGEPSISQKLYATTVSAASMATIRIFLENNCEHKKEITASIKAAVFCGMNALL